MTNPSRQPYPIVILAFNRPDYLRQVLESLTAQQGIDLTQRHIIFFQDGGFNEHSKATHAKPAAIEASIAVFRELIPHGEIKASPVNLGVALNFDRAEHWAFVELQADACIFLEDDMVLSPHYISVLDRMLDMAVRDRRIGYVGAYGDWNRPLAKQRENPGKLMPLTQNWAFGLTRHQWEKNQPFMNSYLSLVRGIDYRLRPHSKIFDLYTSYGMERVESSQDRAKLIACSLTGGLRVNTMASLAQYIGREGLHLKEAEYLESGFQHTEIYPDADFDIETLTDERYRQLFDAQLRHVSASSPHLNHNKQLNFGLGGNGLKGLRNGFYPPENWGSWSNQANVSVSFTLPSKLSETGLKLEITARHYAPEGTSVPVEVSANGTKLGTIELSAKQSTHILALPANIIDHSGFVHINFRSASITSPKEDGNSSDSRKLGIGLSQLTLV